MLGRLILAALAQAREAQNDDGYDIGQHLVQFLHGRIGTGGNVVIPEGVTDLEACFESCYMLEKAPVLPQSVQNMLQCFRYCYALTGDVQVPAGISLDYDTLYSIFNGCVQLESVTLHACPVAMEQFAIPENIRVNALLKHTKSGICSGQ